MRKTTVCAALIPLLIGVLGQARADLVTNGSFETPAIFPNPFVTVSAGDPTLTGWTVGLNSIDIVSSSGFGDSRWSFDGDQSLDMSGSPGPGSISQVLGTTAGGAYTLNFAVSSNGGPFTDGLQVFWDGILLDTITSPAFGTWDTFTYSVTASTGSTALEFDSTVGGDAGPLLDAVSVNGRAVPEPATLALVGVGGLTLLIGRKRFRRA
jgi:choice-of-anchor C domain-containing protein